MLGLYQPSPARTTAAAILILLFSSPLFAQDALRGVVRLKVSEQLANDLESRRFGRSASGDIVTGFQTLDDINRRFGVRKFTRVFPHAGKFEARHRKHGLHLWYEVLMDKTIDVPSALQSYKSDKHILRAEAVLRKAIIGSGSSTFGPRAVLSGAANDAALPDASDDPMLPEQWHYNNTGQSLGTPGADISLFEAWKAETGKPEVIVAVTDGGVQTDHPDLAENMWTNTGEIPGNGRDDDNNGYVDDIHGYSFVSQSGDILAHEHGTHVAGTVAAVSNNGIGVAGVAGGSGNGDGVRLMSCAVFHYDSVPDGFAQAYVYSADNGAVISQNSWGYTLPGVFEQVVLDAIDYFIEEAGKDANGQQTGPMAGGIVLFSTGNSNDEGNYYPAFYEPVVAVGATDHNDERAHYSNYGTWVDISAPGGETDTSEAQGVLSTLPGGLYGQFMGTSMACPHVTGVAALIVSRFGKQGFLPTALRARLLTSVDDIAEKNQAYAGKIGAGRLNAGFALRMDDRTPPRAISDLSVAGADVGTISLSWTSPLDSGDVVTAYDLRYSTSPITAANFDSAKKAEGLPAPSPPGSKESFTVRNLHGGTLFYFAVRSSDFEGNVAPISNVVSHTSVLTPAMVIIPSQITGQLRTAENSGKSLTIKNEGEGILKFSIRSSAGANAFASISPESGEVQPGASASITVTFSASRKLAGTYSEDLLVESNDPSRQTVAIALVMEVTNNGAPIATVHPDTADFNSVRVGDVSSRTVTIRNEGSDPLLIERISSNHEDFAYEATTPVSLKAFDHADIRLTFAPKSIGPAAGVISIFTNDPQNPALTVEVAGEGLQDEPIVVAPRSFNETIESGSRLSRTLTMRNNGSKDRHYQIEVTNPALVQASLSGDRNASARLKGRLDDSTRLIIARRLEKHQQRLATLPERKRHALKPMTHADQSLKKGNTSARGAGGTSLSYTRETRIYATGFEEFVTGPLGEQHGWFTTQGWMIEEKNPDTGVKHFRGTSTVSGTGETYAISPYLFEYEELYYPQYSSIDLRVNLDRAEGTTWEVVPQDPWSYVATRIRFNPDKTIDALVVGDDYGSQWKRVPARAPAGYFSLAVEYNNAGSDTSGFPVFQLFINNVHVFSGTGLASGIGQLAFVSPMETAGPVFEADNIQLIGGEYIPQFITPRPSAGVIPAGGSVNVDVEFDASVIKPGTYESDLVVRLDEVDSLTVPLTVTIPGSGSLFRDVNALYMVLEKNETGRQVMILRNTGGVAVDFRFEHQIPGLAFRPSSGKLQVRQEEIVEIEVLTAPGIYEGEVRLHTSLADTPEIIPVHITMQDSGAVFFAPASLDLQAKTGEVSTHTLQLRNDGINTVSFISKVQKLDSVVTLLPQAGTIAEVPLNLQVSVDARHLPPGEYSSLVRFTTNDPDARTSYTNIKLTVSDDSVFKNGILRELWTGAPGNTVSSIPLASPPASTQLIARFEAPANDGDNYGARLRGYVIAPYTGSYIFSIASNDHSELWLSTDAKDSNKRKIAFVTGFTNPGQWSKYASQTSEPIHLVANRKYYIEALHKEGVGSDHLAVGWQLPNGAAERPIPAPRVLPFGSDIPNTPPRIHITSPSDGESFQLPARIDIEAEAFDEDGHITKVEFFRGETLLATDADAPYSYRWENAPAGNHKITVVATDNAGAADSASVRVAVGPGVSCADAGYIVREQWDDVPGTLITSIPLEQPPASTQPLSLFESPANAGDNYGTRIRGYICVPMTGNYIFWIASNDKGELWLSSDSGEDHKRRIAHVPTYTGERQWNKFADQQSSPVHLEAGKMYYIEALHKEGVGTDHLAVGWQLPDGSLERPVAGPRLVPYISKGGAPRVSIQKPASGETFLAPATIGLHAIAEDPDGAIAKVEFFNGNEKIGEDTTAPYSFTWSPVSEGNYLVKAIAHDDQGLQGTSAPVQVAVQAGCSASGSITREYWSGVSGNQVSTIPVNAMPTGIGELTIFEGPANSGTNYGARISGYICPPETGEYYFWISSNDHSELWISTDENPATKKMIASVSGATAAREWDKFPTQKSAAVTLAKGRSYYIEALHKQGVGLDHVAVGWQLPGGTLERPVPGSRLSPSLTQDAASHRITPGSEFQDATPSVHAFPNPVKGGKLTITVNGLSHLEGEVSEITIRQLTGLSVYSASLPCSRGCSAEIDVQHRLTPGIYILQVKTGIKTFTEKLIVP